MIFVYHALCLLSIRILLAFLCNDFELIGLVCIYCFGSTAYRWVRAYIPQINNFFSKAIILNCLKWFLDMEINPQKYVDHFKSKLSTVPVWRLISHRLIESNWISRYIKETYLQLNGDQSTIHYIFQLYIFCYSVHRFTITSQEILKEFKDDNDDDDDFGDFRTFDTFVQKLRQRKRQFIFSMSKKNYKIFVLFDINVLDYNSNFDI